MKKSGISQIPRGMAENTVEMRKDSAKSRNVGMSGFWPKPEPKSHNSCRNKLSHCQLNVSPALHVLFDWEGSHTRTLLKSTLNIQDNTPRTDQETTN